MDDGEKAMVYQTYTETMHLCYNFGFEVNSGRTWGQGCSWVNLIKTVQKGEFSFSFRRKFTCNCILIFFDCGVETSTKFYETIYTLTHPTLPSVYIGETFSVTRLPGLPWTNQLFIHFLTKRRELFTWEARSWLGQPLWSFLQINNLARSAGQLGQNETVFIRACASAVGLRKGVKCFLISTLTKVDSAGRRGWLFYPTGIGFLHKNGVSINDAFPALLHFSESWM